MTKAFNFPVLGRGVYCVWYRNYLYLKQTIWMSMFWLVLEPVVFLLAIGYGVGSLIPEVANQSYIVFYAPGLMAATGMMVSFYESTYGTFTKLSKQKTFQTLMLSPISFQEIVFGEILWATFKGLLSSVAIGFVAISFGVLPLMPLLPVVLVLALNCFVFSALGMLMSSYAKGFDWFVFSQSGIIMPMYMFSGVLFPVEVMPEYVQGAIFAFPLTHTVMSVRSLFYGELSSSMVLSVSLLILMGVGLARWSISRMSMRLAL